VFCDTCEVLYLVRLTFGHKLLANIWKIYTLTKLNFILLKVHGIVFVVHIQTTIVLGGTIQYSVKLIILTIKFFEFFGFAAYAKLEPH